jgi:hypothetical protein
MEDDDEGVDSLRVEFDGRLALIVVASSAKAETGDGRRGCVVRRLF